MKFIVGLDIGVNSIGWSVTKQDEQNPENSEIIKSGVRLIPATSDEQANQFTNFTEGKPASFSSEKQVKKSIRKQYSRRRNRKKLLTKILNDNQLLNDEHILKSEKKEHPALALYRIRNKAASEKISLQELGRIFILLNQKRGYKSNRKEKTKENEKSELLKKLKQNSDILKSENGETLTIGQYLYQQIEKDNYFRVKEVSFFRHEYIAEFDKIWNTQKEFYPEILTDKLKKELKDQIIYFQRPLKSKKSLLSNCLFYNQIKVIAKSNPLFQMFRIWQDINNLVIDNLKIHKEKIEIPLDVKIKWSNFLRTQDKLTKKQILSDLNLSPDRDFKLRIGGPESDEKFIKGNKTIFDIREAIGNSKSILDNIDSFSWEITGNEFDKQFAYQLWHVLYSLESHDNIEKTLKKYDFSEEQIENLMNIHFSDDYGSLSAKAIKKLMPYLEQGKNYSEACKLAGFNHSNSLTLEEMESRRLEDKLIVLKRNELHNPVVEKILNQMVNLINSIIDEYGKPDEVRIELVRELRNNSKKRKQIAESMGKNNKFNDECRLKLKELNVKQSIKNLEKYKLWLETGEQSVYTGNMIKLSDLFDSNKYDVEHIIPKSKLFDDSFLNKTIAEREVNASKGNMTAYDYMSTKGSVLLAEYEKRIKSLYENKSEDQYIKNISKPKFDRLNWKEADIPSNFIERQLKDTQYITKEAKKRLEKVVRKVNISYGEMTAKLRHYWGLDNMIKDFIVDRFKDVQIENLDTSKREDQRHHAVDAIVTAFCSPAIQQYLSKLSGEKGNLGEKLRAKDNDPWAIKPPYENFRKDAEKSIDQILVSYRKRTRLVSNSRNIIKVKDGKTKKQIQKIPRGSLHKETIYGKVYWYKETPVKIDKKFDILKAESIVNPEIKKIILEHLQKNFNSPEIAFKDIKKNPLLYKEKPLESVNCYEQRFTVRKPLDKDFKNADDVVDVGLKKLIKERIKENGDKEKGCFTEDKPLIFNGKPVKRVTIFANADELKALHTVNDGGGDEGKDFVFTRNNYVVGIYEDKEGKRSEEIVTFWDAVEMAKQKLPILKNEKESGEKLVLSLMKNDMVLYNWPLSKEDIFIPENAALVSKYLYRVQKISSIDYRIINHLETKVDLDKEKRIISWERISSLNETKKLIKVKIDRLGRVVSVLNQ